MSQDLFEFKAGPSKPHSQIWGEIVTHLVKILKLYQLVEAEEASKFSYSSCLWNSPFLYLLLSDLETEDTGSKTE